MNAPLVIIVVVATLAVVAVLFGAVLLSRSLQARGSTRAVVALVSRKEAILASYRALTGILDRLAIATDAQLDRFSVDPRDDERSALSEIASQMRITEDELKNTEVARSLERVVISMEDAARLIYESAGAVGGAGDTDPLSAASEIDLAAIAAAVGRMESALHEAAQHVHVDDHSIYGGGLYI